MTASATPQSDRDASFDELTKLIHGLHETWVAYTQMFTHTPERVAEMNRHAGFVFALTRSSMVDSVLLGISKALDDDGRTLSLRKAIADLPDAPPGSRKAERKEFNDRRLAFLARCEALRTLCQPILTHRDRRIAHDDKKVVMGQQPLPDISHQLIHEAMKGIADLCHDISVVRTGGTGLEFIGAEMDVEPVCRALFWVLRAGNHFLDQQRTEYHDLLARAGRGEVIENLEDELRKRRQWTTWT
jgi:HEPN superfamily AbiU2-like protein